MNILIVGAGVLGTLFAVRFKAAGHFVRTLARGRRFDDLRRYGLALQDVATGRQTFLPAEPVSHLEPDDDYDLVIVPVRKTQLGGILPALAANRRVSNILFMVFNAAGPAELIRALGAERILLGYAGLGGVRSGPLVRLTRNPSLLQKTVVGELHGGASRRVKAVRRLLQEAGFPTSMSPNMDAWLKTHAAWVVPVALALYGQGGDARRLASERRAVRLMAQAIREGLSALRGLSVPVTGPFWVRLQGRLPEPALAVFWEKALRTDLARVATASHAYAAREELACVGAELRRLVASGGRPAPALDELFARYCSAYPVPGEMP